MSESSNHAMNECLRAVWLRTWRKHAAGGLLAFTRWFVPMFLLVIAVDRFAYFPGWLRGLVALVLVGAAGWRAWRCGWSRLRRYDALRAARQVEASAGGMDSLLVTAVHYEKHGASAGTSAAMWEHTRRKAVAAASAVDTRQVVAMTDLRRPLRIAAGVVAVLVLVGAMNGPFLVAGIGRLFTPWQAIAYPTKTRIDLGTGDLVVKEGAPADVEIRFSGVVPTTAKLALRTGNGRPRELVLDVVDGSCTYQIASASRDFSYRVKAGDARSEWREVCVIPAPRIAEVKVSLDYPGYIGRATEQVEALTLTVPEQTMVRWELTLDTPVRAATLHRDGADDLPLVVGAGGRTLTLEETATASRGYSFSWTEEAHGFEFESPRYFLQVASDQVPRVELTSPQGNLSAMLGRPLRMAARVQDDHGIGTTTITYRVNLRPEKTITLATPLRHDAGEQAIDWDYRREIPDLQIGDTVSFVVEVTDKHPGETGPHRARSESRRITFLSREDYLAEITKQMERLLNRVRTLYRQQRAAHELMVGLDPGSDTFVPTCQLEAIRQEMVREQLVATADEVQTLLDDLAANQVGDAIEGDVITTTRDALRSIATDHVARAAELLRAQVGAAARDPQPAVDAVNTAARELACLVLLRGIDASREVFARETHVIARDLARLRLRLLTAGADHAEMLARDHRALAAWTRDLFDQLRAAMKYDKRPLAVLGLARRMHALRVLGVADSIDKAAALAAQGRTDDAAAAQYVAIRPLLEAEFSMRAGSEYAMITDLRERLALMLAEQQELHAATGADGFKQRAADIARRQADLRAKLVLAPLPGIPAPRTRLGDLHAAVTPPCDELRLGAEGGMTSAVGHLTAMNGARALASQGEVMASLKQLDAILARWSDELAQKTIGASAQVSDATDHIGVLSQLENRQLILVEQAEEAALDEKNPASLLEGQQVIASELEAFVKELSAREQGAGASLLPMLGRLGAASKCIALATNALQGNRVEDALEPQEQAAGAIAEARGLAEGRLAQLNLLQQLIGFEQAVAAAGSGMADIVDTQKDLLEATKAADEKTLVALTAPQRNLHRCLGDIAPFLDLVAARLDVGTPLVFAASDVEDALTAMEDGDGDDAVDIQAIAVESLAKVQSLVAAVSVQTGYVAEIVEFLQRAQSDASMLAYRQRQLRDPDAGTQDLSANQQALAADAVAFGRTLTEVAGMVDSAQLAEVVREKLGGADTTLDFNAPAVHMQEALRRLAASQPAADEMLAAEQSLDSGSNQINVIISMLNGLPGITLTKASPPELKRLIDILDVASRHRAQMRRTPGAGAKALATIAKEQDKLAAAITKAAQGGLDHPLLAAARDQLADAVSALAAAKPADASRAQWLADQALRHFIIEQSLILNTAPPPVSSSDSEIVTESETTDLYETEAVGFVADFVSGEAPKDNKSEWEILGTRNRAALNQNFARELPLEYRATLKNYYERVAK